MCKENWHQLIEDDSAVVTKDEYFSRAFELA